MRTKTKLICEGGIMNLFKHLKVIILFTVVAASLIMALWLCVNHLGEAEIDTAPSVEVTEVVKEEPSDYETLLAELNAALNEKNFSDEVRQLFVTVLDLLYQNYPSWQKAYRDLPAVEDYIRSHLIDTVKLVEFVDFIDEDSEEAQKLYDEGEPSGWTEIDFDDRLKIVIIGHVFEDSDNEYQIITTAEMFFHELTHCREKRLVFNSDAFCEECFAISDIVIEGGATFHEKFVFEISEESHGSWSVENSGGTQEIDYEKNNCIGYLLQMNAYEKLVYLVGFEAIDQLERNEISFDEFKGIIASKYGKAQTEAFFEKMVDWYDEYDVSYQSDAVFRLSVELENMFLAFMKKDIMKMSYKEAEEFRETYHIYRTKIMPRARIPETYEDITDSVFNVAETDRALEEKLTVQNNIGENHQKLASHNMEYDGKPF